jgi:hypothetical protein
MIQPELLLFRRLHVAGFGNSIFQSREQTVLGFLTIWSSLVSDTAVPTRAAQVWQIGICTRHTQAELLVTRNMVVILVLSRLLLPERITS